MSVLEPVLVESDYMRAAVRLLSARSEQAQLARDVLHAANAAGRDLAARARERLYEIDLQVIAARHAALKALLVDVKAALATMEAARAEFGELIEGTRYVVGQIEDSIDACIEAVGRAEAHEEITMLQAASLLQMSEAEAGEAIDAIEDRLWAAKVDRERAEETAQGEDPDARMSHDEFMKEFGHL